MKSVKRGKPAKSGRAAKPAQSGKGVPSGKAAKSGKSGKPEPMPVRWRERDGRVLLTNDCGDYAWLERKQLDALMDGTLRKNRATWDELTRRNMIRSPEAEAAVTERLRRRSHHLFCGTSLHIVVLTLRCDHNCIYCHASRQPAGRSGFDMTRETADKVLDAILAGPEREATIEFQGGEPRLNFDVLRHFVVEGRRRADACGKRLYFSLVSHLCSVTPAQVDFLVDNGVAVCTSLDGPAVLHDHNRRLRDGSSHAQALAGIQRFTDAYKRRKLDPSLAYVNALVTVSRASLASSEAIIDEYVRLGQKVIHLRPLNPFGMGLKIWNREGYTADEFLRFYERALDHVIQLNQQGVEMAEKMASLMLTRILTDDDPNYMDLRSPCGAGIGQLAYHHDGRVYTCDEGRMVGAMGDDLFCIGNVHENSYAELMAHPTVRSLCVSSCLECLPGCSECAYAPYCGVCPVYNYVAQGDLVATCASNDRCKIQMGILDYLFRKLAEPGVEPLLRRWTETRDRSSVFEQRPAGPKRAGSKKSPASKKGPAPKKRPAPPARRGARKGK